MRGAIGNLLLFVVAVGALLAAVYGLHLLLLATNFADYAGAGQEDLKRLRGDVGGILNAIPVPSIPSVPVNRIASAGREYAGYVPSFSVLAYVGIAAAVSYGAVRVGLIVWEYRQYCDWVASCFIVAERELNALIQMAEQDGRIGRVEERFHWNDLDKHKHPFRLWGDVPEPNNEIAKAFIERNEGEMTEGRQDKGRAKAAAFLLRQVLGGGTSGAKAKIVADYRNKGGKKPFVPAGIAELIGYDADEFDGTVWRGGVHWRTLSYVIRSYGFPRDIVMLASDASGNKVELRNHEALRRINSQVLP
jgi:hypothetical protein